MEMKEDIAKDPHQRCGWVEVGFKESYELSESHSDSNTPTVKAAIKKEDKGSKRLDSTRKRKEASRETLEDELPPLATKRLRK